jgi:hypothetical protein
LLAKFILDKSSPKLEFLATKLFVELKFRSKLSVAPEGTSSDWSGGNPKRK